MDNLSSQLRHSIPLVSPVGEMDVSLYKDIRPDSVRKKIDNLDDIDDLLADIITDDDLEEL